MASQNQQYTKMYQTGKINPSLAKDVRKILDENKAERHLRGGMATKLKYMHKK